MKNTFFFAISPSHNSMLLQKHLKPSVFSERPLRDTTVSNRTLSSTALIRRPHLSHWSPRASGYRQWGHSPSTKRSARKRWQLSQRSCSTVSSSRKPRSCRRQKMSWAILRTTDNHQTQMNTCRSFLDPWSPADLNRPRSWGPQTIIKHRWTPADPSGPLEPCWSEPAPILRTTDNHQTQMNTCRSFLDPLSPADLNRPRSWGPQTIIKHRWTPADPFWTPGALLIWTGPDPEDHRQSSNTDEHLQILSGPLEPSWSEPAPILRTTDNHQSQMNTCRSFLDPLSPADLNRPRSWGPQTIIKHRWTPADPFWTPWALLIWTGPDLLTTEVKNNDIINMQLHSLRLCHLENILKHLKSSDSLCHHKLAFTESFYIIKIINNNQRMHMTFVKNKTKKLIKNKYNFFFCCDDMKYWHIKFKIYLNTSAKITQIT